MDNYKAEGTKSTPHVELDYGGHRLTFKGQSYPENAYNTYEPIYKWVEEYFSETGDEETIADFSLSYINTSSTKCLIILFDMLNKAWLNGKKLTINWHYDEENGFDYDMGKDFKEDLDIPFNFISVREE